MREKIAVVFGNLSAEKPASDCAKNASNHRLAHQLFTSLINYRCQERNTPRPESQYQLQPEVAGTAGMPNDAARELRPHPLSQQKAHKHNISLIIFLYCDIQFFL